MSIFQSVVTYINNKVYKPNQLVLISVQEEAQNAKYSAGIFKLGSNTVRFRVANVNPTKMGQFIFPKAVLLNKKILESHSSKGKMGMKVYPSWDTPTSSQAINTQSWQQKYFIDFSESKEIDD